MGGGSVPTPTCTSHCRACGRHFHGDGAFDKHRVFLDPKYPDWRDRICADPGTVGALQLWTAEGECRISGEELVGVEIWNRTPSASALAHFARKAQENGLAGPERPQT